MNAATKVSAATDRQTIEAVISAVRLPCAFTGSCSSSVASSSSPCASFVNSGLLGLPRCFCCCPFATREASATEAICLDEARIAPAQYSAAIGSLYVRPGSRRVVVDPSMRAARALCAYVMSRVRFAFVCT